MRIERLSENRIKVTLTTEDLLKWNITYETLLPDNPDTNRFFRDIISQAIQQTGIKLDSCRLTVEAMKRDGNTYVIIIMKNICDKNKPARYKFRWKKKTGSFFAQVLIYSFQSMNDLEKFAKNNSCYCFLFDGKNSLFRDKEKLVLVVALSEELYDYAILFDDRICEYADRKKMGVLYQSYLNEYANLIIKDTALKTIYCKM